MPVFLGTSGDDTLEGGDGNDFVGAGANFGDDLSHDTLDGGDGEDILLLRVRAHARSVAHRLGASNLVAVRLCPSRAG